MIGLTQMVFAFAAAYLLVEGGFNWRSGIAASLSAISAIASRYLFAGRPDPRLESGLKQETSTELNGREAKARGRT